MNKSASRPGGSCESCCNIFNSVCSINLSLDMEVQCEWLDRNMAPSSTEMKLMRARVRALVRDRERLKEKLCAMQYRMDCMVALVRLYGP